MPSSLASIGIAVPEEIERALQQFNALFKEAEQSYAGIRRSTSVMRQMMRLPAAWGEMPDPLNLSPAQRAQLSTLHATWSTSGAEQQTKRSEKPVDAPSRDMLVRTTVTVEEDDSENAELAHDAEMLLGYDGLRKHLKQAGSLRAVLAKLDIEVLDERSVDAYKQQMVEHYRTHNKMQSPTWRLQSLRSYAQPVPEFVLAKAVAIKRELPNAEFFVDQLAVDPFLIVSTKYLHDPMSNCSRRLDQESAAYVEVWDEPKFEAKQDW